MVKRREFLAMLASCSLVSAGPGRRSASPSSERIKPRKLQKGQTIGLVAPASGAFERESVHYARDIIASLGFNVKMGGHLFERWGYLAGSDQQRASDVNAMFADDQVHAIMVLRGGYGSLRMLPYLDFDLIRSNPKVVVGYSDITAMLNAITHITGLVTFHGPIAKQEFSPYTLAEFKKVLFGGTAPQVIGQPPPFESAEGKVERHNRVITVHGGRSQGNLIGGNLSLMARLVGTPYEPDYQGKILFLEEVHEPPYRIDGMLMQLILAGRLQKLAGIAFGKCVSCQADGAESLSLEDVLRDALGRLEIPTIVGAMIGHVEDQTTVPIGVRAELDADLKRIKLLESAVTN